MITVVKGHLLAFCILVTAALMSVPTQVRAQDYPCRNDIAGPFGTGELLPGRCFPMPTSSTHPFDVRAALYVRCRVARGGVDEYTNNCCDHLSETDARALKVCRGRTNPSSGLGLLIELGDLRNPGVRVACRQVDCEMLFRLFMSQ